METNYRQFQDKFGTGFVLQGLLRGRSRLGRWSAMEGRVAKHQSDPPLNYERRNLVENLENWVLETKNYMKSIKPNSQFPNYFLSNRLMVWEDKPNRCLFSRYFVVNYRKSEMAYSLCLSLETTTFSPMCKCQPMFSMAFFSVRWTLNIYTKNKVFGI